MRKLRRDLKDKCSDAFRENALLSELTEAEREEGAVFYNEVAAETVGRRHALARLYNLERARFLRGEVDRVAPSAPDFGREINYEVG